MAANHTASIKSEEYAHSPVHYALSIGDHAGLLRIVSSLPKLADSDRIHTEADAIKQERVADLISAVLDRRDVPFRETPLHLAIRLNDSISARALASAGADVSLQNSSGWNALQEALCRRSPDMDLIFRSYHRSALAKWRRRLPRLLAVLRRMRDFYMEISFHFESSIVPFVGKIAPSDTYRIWKRDGNLRADTSLAGFDGLKIQRADQSFLFFGDGDLEHNLAPGSLLVVNHDNRRIFDAFENARSPMKEPDIEGFCSQTSVYRPGMDVTKAELIGRTNWRRQEKTEIVGHWLAKVYELQNVVFTFRTKKLINSTGNHGNHFVDFPSGGEQILPLDLDLDGDSEEGFLVAENPNLKISNSNPRRHSSFHREDRNFISSGRRSFDIPAAKHPEFLRKTSTVMPPPPTKEKEIVKRLRPYVWLTDQFPLQTEEILPLLDILANKVKAVARLREILTTKFPSGTFPVKVAIPVVPTVRVVITFTKFVELSPSEEFFTPLSTPSLLRQETDEMESRRGSFSWGRRNINDQTTKNQESDPDPFAIPIGYSWSGPIGKNVKTKKSKSIRKHI